MRGENTINKERAKASILEVRHYKQGKRLNKTKTQRYETRKRPLGGRVEEG